MDLRYVLSYANDYLEVRDGLEGKAVCLARKDYCVLVCFEVYSFAGNFHGEEVRMHMIVITSVTEKIFLLKEY